MKKFAIVLVALLVCSGVAEAKQTRQTAHSRKCPPTCHHRRTHKEPPVKVCHLIHGGARPSADHLKTHIHTDLAPCAMTEAPCPEPVVRQQDSGRHKRDESPERTTSVLTHLATGFEVHGGFRWEPKHECPTFERPIPPSPRHEDPPYAGVGFRFPNRRDTAGLALRIDWNLDGDYDHEIGVEAYWHPFRN